MIYPTISSENPWLSITPKVSNPPLTKSPSSHFKPILSFHHQDPNTISKPVKLRTHLKNATLLTEAQVFYGKSERSRGCEERIGFPHVGSREMLDLCGFGYWVQGFRCFPWLALNFQMAYNLSLHPSTLQLVQNYGNLPMVAKPLYGILSDILYINGAHRIPYISIGGWLTFPLLLLDVIHILVLDYITSCTIFMFSAFRRLYGIHIYVCYLVQKYVKLILYTSSFLTYNMSSSYLKCMLYLFKLFHIFE